MHTDTRIHQEPLPCLTNLLRNEWQQIAESLDVNFSLLPEWTEICAKSHGIWDRSKILAVYRNQNLVATFPATISANHILGIPLRSFELISNLVSYHNRPISFLNPGDTLDVLVDLANAQGADVLHLAGILDESDFGKYLDAQNRQRRVTIHSIRGEVSPYLPLQTSWDRLLASKPKKFRYKVRKRTEALHGDGGLRMQWFEKPQDCEGLLQAMRVVENNSWKKDAGLSIFEKNYESCYHELLLPFLSSRNAMFGNVLFQDEMPVAYSLCCVRNGWVGQLKTSFDARFAQLSPGSLVIDCAIRHALQLGAVEFDFLGGADPHKLAWTKLVRTHTDHYLYLKSSLKGRAIGRMKQLRKRFL
jgi:CelD/BcsL family acetyltransferase involved in cellulose biosynthesis